MQEACTNLALLNVPYFLPVAFSLLLNFELVEVSFTTSIIMELQLFDADFRSL